MKLAIFIYNDLFMKSKLYFSVVSPLAFQKVYLSIVLFINMCANISDSVNFSFETPKKRLVDHDKNDAHKEILAAQFVVHQNHYNIHFLKKKKKKFYCMY